MQRTSARNVGSYEPRLRQLFRATNDLRFWVGHSESPNSTLRVWLATEYRPVVGMEVLNFGTTVLHAEVMKLQERV